MPGGARGLQNRRGADKVLGGFDSHTPPPGKVMNKELLRSLPAVSRLLDSDEGRALRAQFGDNLVKFAVRASIDGVRAVLEQDEAAPPATAEQVLRKSEQFLRRLTAKDNRSVINATGILLHTGLGRAPLAQRAAAALHDSTRGYSLVHTNPETGARGLREEKIEKMLHELTGAEASTIVSNNAAATFLILNTLAAGREVIISRGQLIEIGGAFRIPEVMALSGAVLREVGTTNRTHLYDYERAIGEKTAALLYVHPSNYRISGFAGSPSLSELGALASRAGLPLIADLGSGALVDLRRFGLSGTTTIGEALATGAQITCSSGDKLIGGPQAGIICGRRDLIAVIRKNPFARMVRVGKLTISAMEETLLHYIADDFAEHVPLYQMLTVSQETLAERAQKLIEELNKIDSLHSFVADDSAYVGGGSMPGEELPSKAVFVSPVKSEGGDWCQRAAKALRLHFPAVFCRVQQNQLIFNMRSLLSGDQERLCAAAASTLPHVNR